ncbi:unnamed protein product [Protopolystoma xenopodis]|uniref:Uncharacterized protein n=1 Tax=Protopolystoma xenopodis TaxID=117903 RepID=A0A3S5BF22_9PLAT|nr:unnamed protein product [Protopolystoma xenopodis]
MILMARLDSFHRRCLKNVGRLLIRKSYKVP